MKWSKSEVCDVTHSKVKKRSITLAFETFVIIEIFMSSSFLDLLNFAQECTTHIQLKIPKYCGPH